MRIAEVHVFQVDLPLNGKAYRMSEGSYTAFDSTIVQIVSDTGVSGWGGRRARSGRPTSRSTPWGRARHSGRWRSAWSAGR